MPTNREDPRARVFISCGQNEESDERATADAIAQKRKALGFDPWIAVEQQTLNGIKEHIFETLDNSEYFIFVDFKRERLAEKAFAACLMNLEAPLQSKVKKIDESNQSR